MGTQRTVKAILRAILDAHYEGKQSALADDIGANRSTVSRWFAPDDPSVPEYATCAKLCEKCPTESAGLLEAWARESKNADRSRRATNTSPAFPDLDPTALSALPRAEAQLAIQRWRADIRTRAMTRAAEVAAQLGVELKSLMASVDDAQIAETMGLSVHDAKVLRMLIDLLRAYPEILPAVLLRARRKAQIAAREREAADHPEEESDGGPTAG